MPDMLVLLMAVGTVPCCSKHIETKNDNLFK